MKTSLSLAVLLFVRCSHGFVVRLQQHHQRRRPLSFVSTDPNQDTTTDKIAQNFESILGNAKDEFDEVLGRKTNTINESESTMDYHMGGNAAFISGLNPAKLTDEEECEETMVDFATGDELCWGDPDVAHRQEPLANQADLSDVAVKRPEFDVIDDYRKGGSHYKPVGFPNALNEDEDCDEPYFDFASGDELCWFT